MIDTLTVRMMRSVSPLDRLSLTVYTQPMKGLQKVPWSEVEKALESLGGVVERKTAKHNTTLVRMPTGYAVSLGKNGIANAAGVSGLMRDLNKAKIDSTLFLAKLEGAAWYNREPYVVSELRKSVKDKELRTPESWDKALVEFSMVIPEKDESYYPYSTGQLLDYAEVKGKIREKCNVRLATQMRNGHGLAGELIEAGEAIKLPSTTRRHAYEYRFTEKAVLMLAEDMHGYYGLENSRSENKIQEEEIPEVPVKSQENKETPPIEAQTLEPGEALLKLCEAHGAKAVWEGYSLNHEKTLLVLAEKLR